MNRKKHSPQLPVKADPELAQWCEALAQISTPVDAVPPGWKTINQLCYKTGIARQALRQKIKRLLAAGQAERKMFRIRLAKNTRPAPHYRIKT